MSGSWEVELRVNGEPVLTIGQGEIGGWLSGVPNIEDHADLVREAADHLRSFIGPPDPQPCFFCGRFPACDGDCGWCEAAEPPQSREGE